MLERPDLAGDSSSAGIIALLGFVLAATAQVMRGMISVLSSRGASRRRPARHKADRREGVNSLAFLVIKNPLHQNRSLRLCP